MFSTVGCSARICGILSVESQTISLGKQHILVFSMHIPFTSLTAKSPTIRVWGPVVSFLCSLLLLEFISVLTLLCEDERLSRSSDGDPGPCSSGINLFSSCTLCCLGGLLLTFPLAAFYGCVPLSTGVDEALCLDCSVGQPSGEGRHLANKLWRPASKLQRLANSRSGVHLSRLQGRRVKLKTF